MNEQNEEYILTKKPDGHFDSQSVWALSGHTSPIIRNEDHLEKLCDLVLATADTPVGIAFSSIDALIWEGLCPICRNKGKSQKLPNVLE